ncbi:MAG: hypothetical protein J1D77_04395 [Muribaculaceae bacterium]|nr:hypothetical protein [Muribaculaceae bacterium]
MVNTKFNISDSAQKVISQNRLNNFFIWNGNSHDVLLSDKFHFQKKDLYEPITRFAKVIKPEDVWIPNFGKTIIELADDTEVFIITNDDLSDNPILDVTNRFTNKPAKIQLQSYFSPTINNTNNKELLEEIKIKEDKYKRVLSVILLFLMECWIYMEKCGEKENLRNPNILSRLLDTLQPLVQFTASTSIQRYVEKLLVVVEQALRENAYPKQGSVMFRELQKKFGMIFSNETKYRPEYDSVYNSNLMRLFEEVDFILGGNEPLRALKDEVEIAKRSLWGDSYETSMDWLGCYCKETGTICLKLDSIVEFYDSVLSSIPSISLEFVIQKVLLHEFIHAFYDVWARDANGDVIFSPSPWEKYDYNEESLDNALVLLMYRDRPEFLDATSFISYQPYYYKRALDLYEEHSQSFRGLLESLLNYKMYNASTRMVRTEVDPSSIAADLVYSRKSREMQIKIKNLANICYAIFAILIMKKKMTLSDVIALNHKFMEKRKQLWLLDEEDYKTYLAEKKRKASVPLYYSMPLLTSDGQKVYISFQWRLKDMGIIEDIMKCYPHIFN